MKKYLTFLFAFTFLSSCQSSNDVFFDGGVNLTIVNFSNKTYNKGTLYIGAVKDSNFIVTDSLKSNSSILAKKDKEEFTKTKLTIGTFGWTPDLGKVNNISKEGAFLLVIENGPKLFFNPFEFPRPTLDGVGLSVWLKDDELSVLDGKIEKQDFEIVK